MAIYETEEGGTNAKRHSNSTFVAQSVGYPLFKKNISEKKTCHRKKSIRKIEKSQTEVRGGKRRRALYYTFKSEDKQRDAKTKMIRYHQKWSQH